MIARMPLSTRRVWASTRREVGRPCSEGNEGFGGGGLRRVVADEQSDDAVRVNDAHAAS